MYFNIIGCVGTTGTPIHELTHALGKEYKIFKSLV